MAKRTVVRTRFESFLFWMTRGEKEPTCHSLEYARYLFDGYGCAKMSDDVFVRLLMFK